MFRVEIKAGLELRQLAYNEADVLFAAINQNRAHLDKWLRWSGRMSSLEACQNYIKLYEDKSTAGDGFHAGIRLEGQLAGGLVCLYINRDSNKTEIGYWLAEAYTGRGLVTQCSRAVIDYLFKVEKMHRIEIQTTVDNLRSRAVAERLGFKLEGIKRESEWITSSYRDHTLYSLLEYEWNNP